LPGIAQSSAQRKKQSLQVISGRFAKTARETTSKASEREARAAADSRNFREEPSVRCRLC
jgi:hypothetical protein